MEGDRDPETVLQDLSDLFDRVFNAEAESEPTDKGKPTLIYIFEDLKNHF